MISITLNHSSYTLNPTNRNYHASSAIAVCVENCHIRVMIWKIFSNTLPVTWERVMTWNWCYSSLQWRHNELDGVSNHQPHGCLIKENIKAPRHWPLCGEFTGTGEFPAQRASYAENVSIWWRHHVWHSNHIESILHVTCYGLSAPIHLPIGQQPYSLYRNAMSAKRQKVTSVWALFLVTVFLELLLILWYTSSCLNIWHRGLLVRSILLSVMLMWGTIIQLPRITLDGGVQFVMWLIQVWYLFKVCI